MKTFASSACLVLLPIVAFAQGALNPPGAPAPTMKTLDQVEPRIPVNATNTPGDDTFEFIIGNRGSYYLTSNITTSKPVAIYINTGGVTLDLNGFSVLRTVLPGGRGILISGGAVTVRNGYIRGWETGVTSADPNFSEGVYERLVVTNSLQTGLVAGRNWLVDRCIALGNAGSGISGSTGNVRVTNCTASGNGTGISLSGGGSVSASLASGNKTRGVFGNSVTIAGCTVQANEQHGITVGERSVVRDNQISGNGTDPNAAGAGVFVVGDANRVLGNTINGNDKGVFVTGKGNVIDGNNIRGAAGPGIEVSVANGKNIIIRNQAGDNGGSYSAIASGNQVGPIDTNFTATSPFANLQN